MADTASPGSHRDSASFEVVADGGRVDVQSFGDGDPGVAGAVGDFCGLEIGFAQDRLSRSLHASSFEAVVDGGAVHVEVAGDLSDRGASEVGADDLLNSGVGQWVLRGTGHWALEDRTTGVFLGRAGLHRPEREDWPGVEVGWVLHPDYWGRGYATEAGAEAIRYAFDELDLDGSTRAFSLKTSSLRP